VSIRYFKSKFHIFDATVILSSFIVEVTLQGVEEEVASLIVILRLFRVVKIIDELGVAADEQMKELEARLVVVERENRDLKEEVARLRQQ
jgi:voltage-gated hydrogen channel 1